MSASTPKTVALIQRHPDASLIGQVESTRPRAREIWLARMRRLGQDCA